MRQAFYVTLLFLCGLHVVAQQSRKSSQFILKGTISEGENAIIYLVYEVNGERVKDSCQIQQGKFYFTGKIKEPSWAFLKAKDKELKTLDAAENPNIVDFFIDPTTMTATLQYNHFKKIKITGSKTQQEYEMLKKRFDTIDKSSGSLAEKFSTVTRNFIRSHPDSYVSASQLNSYKTRWPLDSVKSYYAALSPAIRNSDFARNVKKIIDAIDNNSAGAKAKGFKRVDINGKPLSLSDFAGKYVLLDFWGSWCLPCRESTPHLIELFKKYHNKGLDIIAIANEYDETGKAWKEAIKKDGTAIWYNILNKEGNNADDKTETITKSYGIQVYPTKILIDSTGTIVGRYTGTEAGPLLDKKLSELFQ